MAVVTVNRPRTPARGVAKKSKTEGFRHWKAELSFVLSFAQRSLALRTGLLILYLQLVDYLFYIGYVFCQVLYRFALSLRIDTAFKSDYAILHTVFHIIIKLRADQNGVEILLNALVFINFDFSRRALFACRPHGYFVDNHLRRGYGFGDGFGLCLVGIGCGTPLQGHNTFFAILTYGDIFQPNLVQRVTNLARKSRRFIFR